MASPIFFPLFRKNYVVQTRTKSGEWKEYNAYKTLAEARQAMQRLKQSNPGQEIRIFNRFTGEIVRS